MSVHKAPGAGSCAWPSYRARRPEGWFCCVWQLACRLKANCRRTSLLASTCLLVPLCFWQEHLLFSCRSKARAAEEAVVHCSHLVWSRMVEETGRTQPLRLDVSNSTLPGGNRHTGSLLLGLSMGSLSIVLQVVRSTALQTAECVWGGFYTVHVKAMWM